MTKDLAKHYALNLAIRTSLGANCAFKRLFECHGLDGQNTGVPFAQQMSPPVPDLKSKNVQGYTDGQLHWIIVNGINPSGMPAWKGILEEDEMWKVVRYIRHLSEKGSFGIPEVFKEEEEQHKEMQSGATEHRHAGAGQPHHHH